MDRRAGMWPLLAWLWAAGCSSTVTTAASGGGAGGGSTSGAGTTSTAGPASGGPTATSASSTANASSAATGGGSCTSSFELVVDNGAPHKLIASCSGAWNPTMSMQPEAYLVTGGPAPGFTSLHVVACAAAAKGEGIDIALADAKTPGSYTKGLVRYSDVNGDGWGFSDDPFKVTITKLGAVGDAVEGTFTASVSHIMNGNAAHLLSGTFHACRVPDELTP